MAQEFYVAVPYHFPELSEPEEKHEIGEFMACAEFDCTGYYGEVRIDGAWHTVWAFRSAAEAGRFVNGWGGIPFGKAVEAKVTELRWPETDDFNVICA